MTIELRPKQERIIQEQLESGRFRSVDEVLDAALDRLSHHEFSPNAIAVERMLEFSRTRSIKLPAGETVEAIVREMRRSQ